MMNRSQSRMLAGIFDSEILVLSSHQFYRVLRDEHLEKAGIAI